MSTKREQLELLLISNFQDELIEQLELLKENVNERTQDLTEEEIDALDWTDEYEDFKKIILDC